MNRCTGAQLTISKRLCRAPERALTASAVRRRYSAFVAADLRAMDAKDHGEQSSDTNGICRLEWIALAIDAARRHKEHEHRDADSEPRRATTPFEIVSTRR